MSLSPTPLPSSLPPDAQQIAQHHDAASVVLSGDDDTAWLHTGISGAAPLYVDGSSAPVHLSSHIDPLARTRSGPLRPDWDAWAQILGIGGPLEGRTPFEGIRRLPPWGRLSVEPGGEPKLSASGWPWLEVDGTEGGDLDTVRDALVDAVGSVAHRGPVTPLLSGGWDSRILATLAAHASTGRVTALTTSSDTATVLEELVAAQVAERLGIDHAVVPPRRDRFAADLQHFVRSVDYQTSLHVWLVPLARALAEPGGTVLDGLGGGIFIGGAFPDDDTDRPTIDKRFARMARYLDSAEKILHPNVAEQVRQRTRTGFQAVAEPLVDHPYGNTFTAYLTRTLPGVSLAPLALLAEHRPVATPFLDDRVVRSALAVRPEAHADGGLYPPLLRPLAPGLADLATASELTPEYRQHGRRVASYEAAAHFRDLLTREPIRGLLAPELVKADINGWRSRLNRTRLQHLIRSLATLALWLQRYGDVLDDAELTALREPAG